MPAIRTYPPIMSDARAHGDPAGVTVLITGLPGSGKTTLARALTQFIQSQLRRDVSLLDGDEVRQLLSSELGFSREHRRLNVLRHSFIAAELCRYGAVVICALIAPYATDRREMRYMTAARGRFVEIYLSTPLAVCEQRDPKGLYARARAGKMAHMTGVDDPYEAPERPELALDTSGLSVEECVSRIIACLQLAAPGPR